MQRDGRCLYLLALIAATKHPQIHGHPTLCQTAVQIAPVLTLRACHASAVHTVCQRAAMYRPVWEVEGNGRESLIHRMLVHQKSTASLTLSCCKLSLPDRKQSYGRVISTM